jgi:GDP-4-dehydro-6-deoxy-D-mannose reductase
VLLLGARGFLGSQLLQAAERAGIETVAPGSDRDGAGQRLDLLDPGGLRRAIERGQPKLIVNAAGAASVGRSWAQPAETFAANATGVLNLLEAVYREAPAAHVLCLSSADVYGQAGADGLPLAEDVEPRPLTPYGASKAAMEVLCGQYARGRGMRIAVVRSFNLLGPSQSGDFAISSFARRIAAAELEGAAEVELRLGNPEAARDFIDVREGVTALLEISRRRLCGTYNLCSGRAVTVGGLVAELSRAARVPVTARHDPALERPADPPTLVGDPLRLREATGFEPTIPLRQTLADMLERWRAELATA